MPRKGENIFKRKDRRWEGRYIKGRSAQGRAVYGYVYAKIYADVKKKLCNAIAAQCNYVQHTMQRTQLEGDKDKKTAVVMTTPKSACSIRAIPIPENLLNIMREHFSSQQGFVLTGSEKYIEPRSMENYFKRVQLKINIGPVNFHVLRHTFATPCVEVGFDVKTLNIILGHANVKITMDKYVHPTKVIKQKNMNRLSDAFLVEQSGQERQNLR